jgi:hypothetical protein
MGISASSPARLELQLALAALLQRSTKPDSVHATAAPGEAGWWLYTVVRKRLCLKPLFSLLGDSSMPARW